MTKIERWGDDLAVRLPASVVDALQLKEGAEIEIRIADGNTVVIGRKPSREELLQRLRAFRGRLPDDYRFDRDEANER